MECTRCQGTLLAAGELRCCAACRLFWREWSEQDHDHWMPSFTDHVDALSLSEGMLYLASGDDEAEPLRQAIGYGGLIAGLATSLPSLHGEEAIAAANALARHRARRGAWDEVELLLRHSNRAVRTGAVAGLERAGFREQPRIFHALAELLPDRATMTDAARFLRVGAWQGSPVAVCFPRFVDFLDHDDADVRGHAYDLMEHHLEPLSAKSLAGVADYSPKVRSPLGETAEPLAERIPLLVRHRAKGKHAPSPGGTMNRDRTTKSVAAKVLAALAGHSDAMARRVFDAIHGVSTLFTFEGWIQTARKTTWI
jgi:hypothetical protein